MSIATESFLIAAYAIKY